MLLRVATTCLKTTTTTMRLAVVVGGEASSSFCNHQQRRPRPFRCLTTQGSSGDDEPRLHSNDIAFKPAESGWGAGSKYTSNFDRIFGNKHNEATTTTATATTTTEPAPSREESAATSSSGSTS
mmetsp:Transcript_9079/g.17290  ORF Transcript_9079/g.17290 Transcript_9079/m.17290 type:complete len:124 (+) Transcript_9079:81-452(+)